MKTVYYSVFLSLLFLGFISCDGEMKSESEGDALTDNIENSEPASTPEAKTFYVLASGGLRLRESPDLTADKKEVLKYGSAVSIEATDATEIAPVSGLTGKMVKTMQGNKIGYAFDGYLSSIPVPEEGQKAKAYVELLKEKGLNASFEQTETENGMEVEDIFSIPASSFQEAFLIGKKVDIFETDFDLLENENAKLTVKNGIKIRQIKAQSDEDVKEITGVTGEIKGFSIPTKSDDIYWMRYITFEYDEANNIKEISVQVAYEGGSWICTLAKEGENYVFKKSSTAD